MKPDIRIDKELSSLIPPIAAEEEAILEESIRTDGFVRDKLVIWDETGILLDGHNRFRIAKKYSLEWMGERRSFKDKEAAKLWMIRNQLGRRNLEKSQRAMLAAKLVTTTHGGDRASDDFQALKVTVEKAAEEAGVGISTLQQAVKVEADAVPEVKAAVTDGTMPVSAAAKLSEEPKATQRRVAKAIRDGKATSVNAALSPAERERRKAEKRLKSRGKYDVDNQNHRKKATDAIGVLIRALDSMRLTNRECKAKTFHGALSEITRAVEAWKPS